MNTLNRDFTHSFRNAAPPFVQFDSLNESLKFFSSHYGLGKLLRFADRNSMSQSIELRMPFLHHQLAEFIFSLPASFKIRQGWTKFILRKSMEKLLPEEITWRKDKIGFEAPQQKFLMQQNIRDLFHDSVLNLQREKIMNEKNIPHLMNWNILIAGQWLKNC